MAIADQRVERSTAGRWENAREGSSLRLGDRLRTGADSLARLELPWMALTLGPGAAIAFPDDRLLSTVLEQGRVELQSRERAILKLVTEEAEVRGHGRVIVRREAGRTLVSALEGRFLVTAAGGTVALPSGHGTIIRAGRPPARPVTLPEPPDGLLPGADPRFVAPGEAVSVDWTAHTAGYHLEVLPVGADHVLIQRDVANPPAMLSIPWPGAFRWRVAARDANGLEGPPSADGLICTDK